MQDMIARAMASRHNTSSSKLTNKIDEIDNAYVRATDERDTEEISLVVDSIKQEIVDKGNEVKESLNANAALKSILPLSEIVNYGAEYTYKSASFGDSELVKVTSNTKADGFIFVTNENSTRVTVQFWDNNGQQSVYGGAIAGRNLITISNNGSQIDVYVSSWGSKTFSYNSDGTYKSIYDGTFVKSGTVLTTYNKAEYTPTADYHPATKKYVDDALTRIKTNDSTLYFRFANDSLYKTTVSASGKATATSTKLTIEEVSALTEQVYALNIVFFKNDELAPTLKDTVYKIVDAYSAYGYYYFTTIASDRTNTNCSITTLCVRSYNRD